MRSSCRPGPVQWSTAMTATCVLLFLSAAKVAACVEGRLLAVHAVVVPALGAAARAARHELVEAGHGTPRDLGGGDERRAHREQREPRERGRHVVALPSPGRHE